MGDVSCDSPLDFGPLVPNKFLSFSGRIGLGANKNAYPKILSIFASICKFWGHLIHCNFIQYHACCRTSFFGWVNKALEIFSLPYPRVLDYSTFEFTTLPYPTRN